MESTLGLLLWRSWEGWGGCWSILFDFASLGLGCLAAADRAEVDSFEVEKLSRQLGIRLIKTSVKENINVHKVTGRRLDLTSQIKLIN